MEDRSPFMRVAEPDPSVKVTVDRADADVWFEALGISLGAIEETESERSSSSYNRDDRAEQKEEQK